MYLKVFRDDIIDGLQKSSNIIPAKTGAAYLRTIWLKAEGESVSIMSTDSNLEFCGTYVAQVQTPGLAGVQGRSFYDLVRKLPAGEIVIRMDDASKNLLIEQGKRKYKLPINDPDWFQKFSDYPEGESVFWSGDFLQDLIDRVVYCISDEDTMEAIACMNVVPKVRADGSKSVETCGLNGHQFAMMGFINDDVHAMLPESGVLIQKKYLNELKKWLSTDEIELAISEKRLFLRTRRQGGNLQSAPFLLHLPGLQRLSAEGERRGRRAFQDERGQGGTDRRPGTYHDLQLREQPLLQLHV